MNESTICNAIVARVGGKYFVNLKGKSGSNVSTEISERQAANILKELEIKLKDYDSESTNTEWAKIKDIKSKGARDIR